MNPVTVVTSGEGDTVALGSRLGALAAMGDVFLFSGELGTGKTCLIRGVAEGAGVSEHAFSPSFVLVREYRGRLSLFHMDFYRLDQPREIEELGLEEYLYGDGVCAIEWAERAAGLLPHEHLLVELSYVPGLPETRSIRFTPVGTRYESLLRMLIETTGGVLSWN